MAASNFTPCDSMFFIEQVPPDGITSSVPPEGMDDVIKVPVKTLPYPAFSLTCRRDGHWKTNTRLAKPTHAILAVRPILA